MATYSFGYAGAPNRVSLAEPAYLEVIAAADRAGVDVNTYAADRAAEARGDAQFAVAVAPAVETPATVELPVDPRVTEFAAVSGATLTGQAVEIAQ
jgi:hypothetical protein